MESYKQWKDKHNLASNGRTIKAGEKVDVRDTEYIWCVGTVELKISTVKRLPLLYIHYEVIERFKFDLI